MIICGYSKCGKEVEQKVGKRKKLHCSESHKQLAYRERKQAAASVNTSELTEPSVQDRTYTAMLSELTELRTKVAELEAECSHLRTLLDAEKRYLADNKPRGFKTWLRKQVRTPFIEKVLADRYLLPTDTKAHYEYRLRTRTTDEEKEEFARLWKRLLLSQA